MTHQEESPTLFREKLFLVAFFFILVSDQQTIVFYPPDEITELGAHVWNLLHSLREVQ